MSQTLKFFSKSALIIMNLQLTFTDGSRWTDLLMAVVLSSYFKMFVFAMMVRHAPSDAFRRFGGFCSYSFVLYIFNLLPQLIDSKWMAGLGVFTSNGTHHWHACVVFKHRGFERYRGLLRSSLSQTAVRKYCY